MPTNFELVWFPSSIPLSIIQRERFLLLFFCLSLLTTYKALRKSFREQQTKIPHHRFDKSWKHDRISLITIPPKSNSFLDPTSTTANALAVLPFTDDLPERFVNAYCIYFLTSSMFFNPSCRLCFHQSTESIFIQVTNEFLIAHSTS